MTLSKYFDEYARPFREALDSAEANNTGAGITQQDCATILASVTLLIHELQEIETFMSSTYEAIRVRELGEIHKTQDGLLPPAPGEVELVKLLAPKKNTCFITVKRIVVYCSNVIKRLGA